MELYYNKTDINQDEMFARTVINTVARKLREEVSNVIRIDIHKLLGDFVSP